MKLSSVITTAAAGATVAATTKAAVDISKKKFCPICTAKKLIHKLEISQKSTKKYDNGVALTPPMGWSSWNLFAAKINEDLIKEIADAMKKSGLVDAGYKYLNIDDCWQASERDKSGRLQCDRATFPNGIANLVKYVNEQGLKLGIYSSNGTMTCEDFPASLKHEAIDADTFAQWGIEYFKYDFCHNVPISSKAPKVSMIEFSKIGESAFVSFKPTETVLKGNARIVKDGGRNSDSGEYITGVCSRNGSFSVEVDAPSNGEYALTITVKKEHGDERFLLAVVNNKNEYHIYVPSANFNNGNYRRTQIVVTLNEGHNVVEFSNPVGSRMDSTAIQYKLMGRELKRATKEYAEKNGTEEKPIVYSICEWGMNQPWKWGAEAGNLWRTTQDIKAIWASVLILYEFTVKLDKYAGAGSWNDPDMLEVGNGNLTYEENKSHFSLWCMMCAPLILGNDVRKFIKPDGTVDTDSKVYQILTNKAMIAINQDKLGVQCKRIKTGIVDILVKPIDNGKVAVCVFNKGDKPKSTEIDIKKIANLGFVNLPSKESYNVYDVWEDANYDGLVSIDAATEKHGVKVYIIQ
ncbi:MAG: glycoside hydrolase family 27 protein [Faecalibacterium sp.]|nr:glycoside hydrolase family 27 protein [Ruminococcus flavefaciens]MCM1392034.1 glycoside hydrolase family 27 protein [Ruminococcus sp.]MCM1484841.1 glycoside hydrolase family 27 protein [Faecalibacterium sp.]